MMPTTESSVEVRVKGRWVTVPAVPVNGNKLIATGKWLRTATVRSEEMAEDELQNPELYIEKLKSDARKILKADIFTFTQKVPSTTPKYPYQVEWESVAAIHLVTFKEWWEGLPQETRKNVRRSQKRGVTVRIKDWDADLIRGLQGVNDDAPLRQGLRNAYYGRTFEETQNSMGNSSAGPTLSVLSPARR
jgi:hypothetical protein